MPTECSQDSLDFGTVEGRQVVACFDGGAMTSDAGALLLGQADRAIGLVTRFAACFIDARASELIEHSLETPVGQRLFGLATRTSTTTIICAMILMAVLCRQVDTQPARASVRGEGTCLRK